MAHFERSTRPPVILVATDQEWSARSFDSILAPNGFAVLRAHTGRQALELARSARPDVIIIDTTIGDPPAAEVCRRLRASRTVTSSTAIVVTAPDAAGRGQRLEAYAAGAWQFCSQPLDGEALLFQLGTFIAAKRETDSLLEQNLLDEVTGLYSITGLARRAVEIGADAQRRGLPLTCVAFEPEVPVRAESTEDETVRRLVEHVGAVCRRSGRTSDAIGRIGQIEFAIVAPVTDSTGAARLIDRLERALNDDPPSDGHAFRIRSGYHSVSNFAHSPVDAVEMLLRATTALRQVRERVPGQEISAPNELPSFPS